MQSPSSHLEFYRLSPFRHSFMSLVSTHPRPEFSSEFTAFVYLVSNCGWEGLHDQNKSRPLHDPRGLEAITVSCLLYYGVRWQPL